MSHGRPASPTALNDDERNQLLSIAHCRAPLSLPPHPRRGRPDGLHGLVGAAAIKPDGPQNGWATRRARIPRIWPQRKLAGGDRSHGPDRIRPCNAGDDCLPDRCLRELAEKAAQIQINAQAGASQQEARFLDHGLDMVGIGHFAGLRVDQPKVEPDAALFFLDATPPIRGTLHRAPMAPPPALLVPVS